MDSSNPAGQAPVKVMNKGELNEEKWLLKIDLLAVMGRT